MIWDIVLYFIVSLKEYGVRFLISTGLYKLPLLKPTPSFEALILQSMILFMKKNCIKQVTLKLGDDFEVKYPGSEQTLKLKDILLSKDRLDTRVAPFCRPMKTSPRKFYIFLRVLIRNVVHGMGEKQIVGIIHWDDVSKRRIGTATPYPVKIIFHGEKEIVIQLLEREKENVLKLVEK